MHGLDGGFDISEGGQHDGRRQSVLRSQALQELEAVHARHHQIGDQYMGRRLRQLLEGVLAVEGGFHRESPGLDHLGQAGALVFFVVRYQHANVGR